MGEKNISGEIAHIRDTFLRYESDYLKQLSQIPEFLNLYADYKQLDLRTLSAKMVGLIDKMENGDVKEQDENNVELEIMLCCLAIGDAVKAIGAKDYDEQYSQGRSK